MNRNQEPKGFGKAKIKAEKLLLNASKIKDLLNKAMIKLKGTNNARILSLKEDFFALIRMVAAWKSGDLKIIPWKSIVFAAAAILYFVNPLDLIFDYIPFIGFIDDVAVIGFVLDSIRNDIIEFKKWEKERDVKAASQ